MTPWDEAIGVRSEIQRITLEHQGRYGYRRMTAELRRQGMLVNHKRVAGVSAVPSCNVVGSDSRSDGPDGASQNTSGAGNHGRNNNSPGLAVQIDDQAGAPLRLYTLRAAGFEDR